MITPYPGESLGLFEAADGSDFSLGPDLHYRADTRTITGADEWRVWFWPLWEDSGRYMDDPGADVVVSWVVEVSSGSGTLVAGEAFDPAYDDETLSPTEALGSYAVTGPATVVIPSALMGAAEFADDGSIDGTFMLHLAASTGSLVVSQVKVRAYPSSGVGGGWSSVLDGFTGTPSNATAQYASANFTGGTAVSASASDAWNTAYADLAADIAGGSGVTSRSVSSVPPGTPFAQQSVGLSDLGPEYASDMQLGVVAVIWLGSQWESYYPIAPGLVEGVDWVRPPSEVPGDTAYYVDRVGSGSTGWLNTYVNFTAGSGAASMPGGPSAASIAGDYAPVGGFSTFGLTHGTEVTLPGSVALDTDGQDILVTLSHTIATGDGSAYPGLVDRSELLAYTWGVDGDPIQTYAILPPYRVWLPGGAPLNFMRVMQRGDGRGMGAGRVFNQGTRQGSSKVFGTY